MHDIATRLSPCLLALALAACSGGSGDGEDTAAPDDADAQDAAPDTVGDDAGDAAEGSDAPWGWVDPRCGTGMVGSCTDCPGRPFICSPCELSANCVADCATDCPGTTSCPDSGACIDVGTDCTAQIFCGCEPPTMTCTQEDSITCLDSCAACPARPNNSYGACTAVDGSHSCLDGDGPEYLCDGTTDWSCSPDCAACGPLFCLNASCSGGLCEPGYLPGMSFYRCGIEDCCTEGFFCTATSTCVASCSECPGAGAGACGEHGICVADCGECFAGAPGERRIDVCDGLCVDLNSNQRHCNACGQLCSGPVTAECSMGHCCTGGFGDMDPFTWCDTCSCCFQFGILCNAMNCIYGCIGT